MLVFIKVDWSLFSLIWELAGNLRIKIKSLIRKITEALVLCVLIRNLLWSCSSVSLMPWYLYLIAAVNYFFIRSLFELLESICIELCVRLVYPLTRRSFRGNSSASLRDVIRWEIGRKGLLHLSLIHRLKNLFWNFQVLVTPILASNSVLL